MSQKRRTWKISENNEVETEKYGNRNKTWQMLKTENIRYQKVERNEDGKINGDGKTKELEMKKSENNKVGNVQNKTDTQTEKEDETESMIGCTDGYPH